MRAAWDAGEWEWVCMELYNVGYVVWGQQPDFPSPPWPDEVEEEEYDNDDRGSVRGHDKMQFIQVHL